MLANPDHTLISRAAEGDGDAFEALVDAYRDRVYGLAMRMLRSSTDAEEVTQETFLSAWQNLGHFRGDSPFGGWLSRIAANFCLMRLRHKRVANEVEAPADEPSFNERGSLIDTVADWKPNALDQSLDSELRSAISAATEALPEDYREVFLLRDVEGLSYEEIGVLTDLSLPAVKSRLHRARLALRATIDRFYEEREA